jgi:hypothetical protein
MAILGYNIHDMSKKTRYLLILIGFLVFVVAAPLIVFYLKGISYDLAERKFVKTGLIAVRIDPKPAQVFIDGKKVLDNEGNIRFLPPKEYNVTVKKEGYFDWSKRLPVLAGQVTWASPAPNKLFLFLKDQGAKTLSNGVTDFYADSNTVLYLDSAGLTLSPSSDLSRSENFSLPKPANSIVTHYNGQVFVLTDLVSSASPATFLVFDKNSRAVTDLSKLFATPAQFKFSGNGQLYALSDGTLFRVDIKAQAKTPIRQQVAAFAFRDNNLYYISQNSGKIALYVSPSPEEAGTEIFSGIPALTR